MRIQFNREKFANSFMAIAHVAPSKTTREITKGIKLEATSDNVTLIATDTSIGVRTIVEGVTIEEPGDIILPCDQMRKILQSKDEELTILTDGNQMKILGERSEFQIPLADPEEFPEVSEFSDTQYFEVSSRLLLQMHHRTAFAPDTENTRYALGGMLFDFEDERLTVVGTDGRRLATQFGPATSVNAEVGGQQIIVPPKAVATLTRFLQDEDGVVQIALRENAILFSVESTTVYAQLVEGRFPRWRDVFPSTDDAKKINLAVGPLFYNVDQASAVTSRDRSGVKLAFTKGQLNISAHGEERGESHLEMAIEYDGEDVSVTVHPTYLTDFLRVLESTCVFDFYILSPRQPVICKTDDGCSYVIMPITRDL